MNDLLLPLVKGVGSERAYELLARSLQTLGGSGYLQDYPIEQYIRDAKIDSLYEGTTAIQGLDLFFRKILRTTRAPPSARCPATSRRSPPPRRATASLKEERKLLAEAADEVKAMADTMAGWAIGSLEAPKEVYKVGLNTTRFLLALGDVVIAWLLLRQAEVALTARLLRRRRIGHGPSDKAFYTGKVAAASFFAQTVLPRIAAERRALDATDQDLMELPEEAF